MPHNRLHQRPFRVVTHRAWLAHMFRREGGVQDFGLDITPESALDTLWWAPGHWVARAAVSGIQLPLTSCGQTWLTMHPEHRVQRRIAVVPARDVTHMFDEWRADELHVKLPEVKTDAFPAEVRDREKALLDCGRLCPDQLVQVSDASTFVNEARFFIANKTVAAWSWYRVGDHWFGDPEFSGQNTPDPHKVRGLATEIARTAKAPNGYSIDIGTAVDGTPLLIEANAAWSSNPYDADMTGVFASVVASHDFDGTQSPWRFDTGQFGKVAPLRLR